MDPAKLNYLAIFAAAVSMFLVGGLWYSPVLFGKAWQRETGLSDEELKQRNPARVFGPAFVLSLLMAFNLAALSVPTRRWDSRWRQHSRRVLGGWRWGWV